MQPPRIVIFDSGVGGLSVLREIQALLPDLPIIYVADNAAFPYGTKSETALVARVSQLFEQLAPRYQPDLVVLACNTASTVTLPHLRQRLSVPVIGVVPAIKPAAQASRSGVIGLLATPGTVRRAYTDELIRQFASQCRVIRVGSSDLVSLAERCLAGEAVSVAQLRPIIAPFFEPAAVGLDTIVLGCTHFPLLRGTLQQAVPRPVNWIDSGAAIARRAAQLLDWPVQSRAARAICRAVFTAPAPQGLIESMRRFGFNAFEQLPMTAERAGAVPARLDVGLRDAE